MTLEDETIAKIYKAFGEYDFTKEKDALEFRDEVLEIVSKTFEDFKIELEEAKAQGFREAIKEMGKVK